MLSLFKGSLARRQLFQKSRLNPSRAAYFQLWGMTRDFTARRSLGWLQVGRNLAPWGMVYAIALPWFCFHWFSDEWKYTLTLGMWKPPLFHPDSGQTSFRSKYCLKFIRPYD